MRKKNIFIAGAVLLTLLILGAGYGWYLYNKPHQGVGGAHAVAKLEADTLLNAYQADENRANRLYLGKVLEVRGKIASQTQGALQLSAGNAMGGINCSLAPGQTLPKTGANAYVTVKGRCTGYLIDVNLVDCIIEQIEQ